MNNELPDHLELLDGFLGSNQVGADAMNLSELDGFLAGMIVCPAVIMPQEWMRQVWGEDGLQVDTVEKVEAVNGLVMARYTQLIDKLEHGVYSPIYDIDAQEQLVWSIWAGGFLRAMALRPEAWHMFGDIGGEDAQHAMFTLMRLCEMSNLPEDDQITMEIDDQLKSAAPDLIPQAIQLLYNAKRAEGTALPLSLKETELKIGRNDPCPCGSGKKYKKCCLH